MAKFRPSPRLRAFLFKRAAGCCEYCKSSEKFSPQTFSIEHILPVTLGGGNEKENLAFSCQGCNTFKGSKTSGIDTWTGEITRYFNPISDEWHEHFAWDETWLHILGKTPTGRATISALQLNREYVINLRRILSLAGEHPPV